MKGTDMKRIVVLLVLALTLCARGAWCQHSVEITWTASLDAVLNPSLTYNVYRASACPGSFTRLNAAPVTGTVYVDTAVATGAAYCYQVTAVLAGIESVPSNQALAALPPASDRPGVCPHRGPIIGWIRCVTERAKKNSPSPVAP
jgi:hypothetical protein